LGAQVYTRSIWHNSSELFLERQTLMPSFHRPRMVFFSETLFRKLVTGPRYATRRYGLV